MHSYLKFKIRNEEFEVHNNIDAENVIELVRGNEHNFVSAERIYESSYCAVTVQGDVIDLSKESHAERLNYSELIRVLETYIV